MKYRPEVDGLRAIAVVPVILFHAGVSGFAGGFVGVDVFFVISGFLITTIILREQAEERFSLVTFYERRARRILPALFLVMFASAVAAWFLLLPDDMKNFAQSVFATSVFSSNFYFWFRADYFDTASELKPLLHTWSLAIEEQYYLGFPLILMLLHRYGRRLIGPVLVAIALGSFVWSQWLTGTAPSTAFYMIQSRAWELMIGSLAALYVFRRGGDDEGGNDVLALGGLAAILASIALFGKQTPFPGLAALLPSVGTMLILVFATAGTRTAALLGWKPFVWIGLVSYSAYLWHQPLLAYARHAAGGVSHLSVPVVAAIFVATFALAWLSWRFVEGPWRDRSRTSRRMVFLFSAIGCAAFMAFGVLGHVTRGFMDRYDTPAMVEAGGFRMPLVTNGHCFYAVNAIGKLEVGEAGHDCFLGETDAPTGRILLIGDSYAAQYEPFWDAVGKARGIEVHAVTTNWCYPSLTENFTGPVSDRAYRQCLANRPFLSRDLSGYDAVVLGGYWGDVDRNGLLGEVTDLIGTLAERGEAPVVVMPNPRPYVRRSVDAVVFGAGDALNVDAEGEAVAVAANARLKALEGPGVTVLDREALFAGDLTDEGLPYSFDGLHIGIYGGRKAAERFLGGEGPRILDGIGLGSD